MVDHNNDKMGKKIVLVYTLYNTNLYHQCNQSIDRLSPAFYFLSRFYNYRDHENNNFHLYVRLGCEGDPSYPGTIPPGLRIILSNPVLRKDDPLPFFYNDPNDPDDQTFYLFLSDRLMGPFLPMHDRLDVPDLSGHRSFVDDPETWITTYFKNPFFVKNVPVVIEGRRGEEEILAMGVSGNYLRSYRFTNVEDIFREPGSRWKIPDDIVESIFVFQHDGEDTPVFLRKRSLCPLQFIFLGVHLIDNTGSSRVAEKIITTLRTTMRGKIVEKHKHKNVIVVPFVLKCDLVITERNKEIENTITRWRSKYPSLVPIEDLNELKSLLGFLWQQETLYRDGFSSSLTNVLHQRYTLMLNTMVGYEKFRGILKENYFGRKILIVHESWKNELQELQKEFSQYLDDVVFVSQSTRELLISPGKYDKAYNGFRSSVLYNCSLLEDSILDPTKDPVTDQTNKVRFLIAGSIEPRKSQLKFLQKVWVPFLQTMNRIRKEKPSTPGIELVMIGYNRLFNKEERRNFESICEAYPEEIIYKGPVEDPTDEFLRCDVCLSTSVEESLPLNVLDAMCVSKPVVAADTFGIQELIVDEETGLIIDSGSGNAGGAVGHEESSEEKENDDDSPFPNPIPRYYNNSRFLTDFVMALDRVVQSKRMREEMGRKARERYEEYFSLDRFKKGYKLLMEGPTFLLHVHQNDPFQSIGLGNRLKSMVSGMMILESMGKPKEGIVVGYEKDHPDMRKLFTSKIVFRERRKGGEKYTIDWLSQFSSHPWYTWRWVVTKQDEVDSYEDMLVINTLAGGQVFYPFEKDEIEKLQKFHKTSSYEDETGGGGTSVVDSLDPSFDSTQDSLSPLYKGVSLETVVDFMYENTPKKIRDRIVRVVGTGLMKNIHPRLLDTKRRVLDFLDKRAIEGKQNTMKGIDLYEGGPSSKNILRFRHPIGSRTRLDRRSLLGFRDAAIIKQQEEERQQRKQKIYRISVALRTWESDRYTERFEDEPGKPLRRFMIHDYLRKVRDIINEIDKKHPDQGSYVVYVLISSDNSMMETVFAQMVSKLHDVFPQLIRTQILEDDVLSQCYDDGYNGVGKIPTNTSTNIFDKISNDEASMIKILLLADQADYLVGDTISTFTELVWYFGEARSSARLVGPYFFDPMIKNK